MYKEQVPEKEGASKGAGSEGSDKAHLATHVIHRKSCR